MQRRSPAPLLQLQLPAVMWSICSVIAWAAAAALLPPAATAARLDLWPTSTGRIRGLNESRYYAHGEERIGCGPPRHRHAAGPSVVFFSPEVPVAGMATTILQSRHMPLNLTCTPTSRVLVRGESHGACGSRRGALAGPLTPLHAPAAARCMHAWRPEAPER